MNKNLIITILSILLAVAAALFVLWSGEKDATIADLTEDAENLRSDRRRLREEYDEVSAEAAALMRENIVLRQDKQQAEAAVKELKEELEKRIEEKSGALTEVQQALKEQKAEAEALNAEIAGLESDLREKTATLTGAQSALEARNAEAEALNAEIAGLESDLREKTATLTGAQSALEARNAEIEALNAKIIGLESDLRRKAESPADAREETEDVTVEAASPEARGGMEGQHASPRTEGTDAESPEDAGKTQGVEDLSVRIAALEKEVANQDATLAEKEASLQSARETEERLKAEMRNLIAEMRVGEKTADQLQAQLEASLSNLGSVKKASQKRVESIRTYYDEMIQELEQQILNKEATVRRYRDQLKVTFKGSVLFESGQAFVTAGGREILRKIGKTLVKVEGYKVRVAGHTDDVPIAEMFQCVFPSNWELSATRAASVVRFLEKEVGVAPERMEIVGRSFYDPVDTFETPEGRARNRRVEIILVPERLDTRSGDAPDDASAENPS